MIMIMIEELKFGKDWVGSLNWDELKCRREKGWENRQGVRARQNVLKEKDKDKKMKEIKWEYDEMVRSTRENMIWITEKCI